MARMRQLKVGGDNKQITNRDNRSLDKYLQEIGKVKLITAQDEVELTRRIKQGDQDALEQLATANLRFVVSVAKQYQGQGMSLPDLISEGNLGLVKAAGRFDETRGFKFISYAVWWVRQSILQALSEQSRIVRLPLNKIGSINKINQASAKLEQQYERPPTADELSEVLEITADEIRVCFENTGRHTSIDAPLNTIEGSGTMLDVLQGYDGVNPIDTLTYDNLKREVKRSLSILSGREEDVVKLFFGIGHDRQYTLEEIGQKFDLTRERVRQIKEKAIRKVRGSSRKDILKAYLG